MDRFLRSTTQKEPALTASFLAVLLAIVAHYFALTDEDLAILGPVMLILAGVVIRSGVFSTATVTGLVEDEDEERARGS